MRNLEKILDEEITPLMEKVLKICSKHEIPMFSFFQYCDDGFCRSFHKGHSVVDHHTALQQCIVDNSVNIDKYIMWLIKEAKKVGHSSIYLNLLDVPTEGES